MPNHSVKMIKLRQVLGLYGSGYGSRAISNTLGISRTTVRKHLHVFNESKLSLEELLSKVDTTIFDFFGLAPTTHVSPWLDALSTLLPDYAKCIRKRGITRKYSVRSILRDALKGIPIAVLIASCASISIRVRPFCI